MSVALKEILDEIPPAPEASNDYSPHQPLVSSSSAPLRHPADLITADDDELELLLGCISQKRSEAYSITKDPARSASARPTDGSPMMPMKGSEAIFTVSDTTDFAAESPSHQQSPKRHSHPHAAAGSVPNGHLSVAYGLDSVQSGLHGTMSVATEAIGNVGRTRGLGPNVIKRLGDAYELICKDFHGRIAPSELEPQKAHTAIVEDLKCLPVETVATHAAELHLMVLKLLQLSRASQPTALIAMQSMESLSPQQFAPVQTTHTVQKEVDSDGQKTINGYLVLEELGRGSCAKVKLGFDPRNSRMVAIKIVRRVDMTVKVGGQTHAQQQFQSLQREIAVMKKLRHKNIVSLYEVIDDPAANKLYLVMQYVDNGPITSIKAETNACRTIEPNLLLRYARHIFAGLMYLHHHKVIHRDIKLENILVSKEKVAYLADFGVSEVFGLATSRSKERSTRGGRGRSKSVIEGHKGTVLYMAPELLLDGQADNGAAVDIWACGVTLYAALTGELPFQTQNDILNAKATLHIPSEHGKRWEHLLRKLLTVSPEERPTAVQAHAEVQRMIAAAEATSKRNGTAGRALGIGSSSLEIAEDDLDAAFTAVHTAGGAKQNSMLQEGRFCRAQLMDESSGDYDMDSSCDDPSITIEGGLAESDLFSSEASVNRNPFPLLIPQPPSSHASEASDSAFRTRCMSASASANHKDHHDSSVTAPFKPRVESDDAFSDSNQISQYGATSSAQLSGGSIHREGTNRSDSSNEVLPRQDHTPDHKSTTRDKVEAILAARSTSASSGPPPHLEPQSIKQQKKLNCEEAVVLSDGA